MCVPRGAPNNNPPFPFIVPSGVSIHTVKPALVQASLIPTGGKATFAEQALEEVLTVMSSGQVKFGAVVSRTLII